jgi:hypothetical protein
VKNSRTRLNLFFDAAATAKNPTDFFAISAERVESISGDTKA